MLLKKNNSIWLFVLILVSLVALNLACKSKKNPTNSQSTAPTPTFSFTYSPTANLSATPTYTRTATTTSTPALTNTPTGTFTLTPTYTPKFHTTATPSSTSTITGTPTITATPFEPYTLQVTYTPHGAGYCPAGVAVGAGYIAVSDEKATVQVFDNNGLWLYDITVNGTSGPNGMAIDSFGELYVSNVYSGGIVGYMLGPVTYTYDYTWTGQGKISKSTSVKIDSHGNLVVPDFNATVWNLSWEDDSVLAQSTGGPSLIPLDVALDANGNIYSAGIDASNNGVIQVFNPQYQYVSSFNGLSWATQLGYAIYGLGVDPSGNLLITDFVNGRVVYATTQGQYLGEIGGFGAPAWLYVTDTGELFVPDYTQCVVKKYTK